MFKLGTNAFLMIHTYILCQSVPYFSSRIGLINSHPSKMEGNSGLVQMQRIVNLIDSSLLPNVKQEMHLGPLTVLCLVYAWLMIARER